MRNLRKILERNRNAIIELSSRHGAHNVRVFGSVARSQATSRSDVDILVDMEPGRSLLDMGALLMDLQDLLGRPVDLVTEKMLHPSIRERVLKESIPL